MLNCGLNEWLLSFHVKFWILLLPFSRWLSSCEWPAKNSADYLWGIIGVRLWHATVLQNSSIKHKESLTGETTCDVLGKHKIKSIAASNRSTSLFAYWCIRIVWYFSVTSSTGFLYKEITSDNHCPFHFVGVLLARIWATCFMKE